MKGVILFRIGFTHISGWCDFFFLSTEGRAFHSATGSGTIPRCLESFFRRTLEGGLYRSKKLIACQIDPLAARGWNIARGTLTQDDMKEVHENPASHPLCGYDAKEARKIARMTLAQIRKCPAGRTTR